MSRRGGWQVVLGSGVVCLGIVAAAPRSVPPAAAQAAALVAAADSPSRYTIGDLGLPRGSHATAMNVRAQVVGYTWRSTDEPGASAWIWDPAHGVRTLRSRGETYPVDINDRGQVAGTARTVAYPYRYRAFVWDARRGMRYLPMPSGWSDPEARAISESGQVVGVVYRKPQQGRAFVWDSRTGVRILPRLHTESRHCEPYAINAAGQVVGYCTVPSRDGRHEWRHAFRWDPRTGIKDLGNLGDPSSTEALDINDSGQVMGRSRTRSGSSHAFVWTPGRGMADLGTLGGRSTTVALDGLNNSGDVIGISENESSAERAFLWDRGLGMVDLGTLGGADRSVPLEEGGYDALPPTEPAALNGSAQVVGVSVTDTGADRAFVWDTRRGMVDLGTLEAADESSGASFINDRGQVVGTSGDALVLWSPRVSVVVRAVRDGTRLWLNVNPNLGCASWRVTIQRQRADRTWARVGVYRTLGRAETRTVDLPRGTYRVVVNTQKGFQRAVSAEVSLRR